jgi:hypothetical protein
VPPPVITAIFPAKSFMGLSAPPLIGLFLHRCPFIGARAKCSSAASAGKSGSGRQDSLGYFGQRTIRPLDVLPAFRIPSG